MKNLMVKMKNKKNTEKVSLWGRLKTALISWLKSKAVTMALKKILGSAMAGGFKGWLVKYIVTELFEELAEPVIKYAFRKVGYIYEVKKGEHILRRIENAENRDDWRDAVRDA